MKMDKKFHLKLFNSNTNFKCSNSNNMTKNKITDKKGKWKEKENMIKKWHE